MSSPSAHDFLDDLDDHHVTHGQILRAVTNMSKEVGALKTALETGCVEVSEIKKSVAEVQKDITALKINAAEARGGVRMGAWMIGLVVALAAVVVAIVTASSSHRTEYPSPSTELRQ